eukprot:4814186-Amphidinium_carterae.1
MSLSLMTSSGAVWIVGSSLRMFCDWRAANFLPEVVALGAGAGCTSLSEPRAAFHIREVPGSHEAFG